MEMQRKLKIGERKFRILRQLNSWLKLKEKKPSYREEKALKTNLIVGVKMYEILRIKNKKNINNFKTNL